jgi:NAD(P)-dependent dehydrogenase (short-subunit alcohol dehydrogenase family)
MTTKSLADTDDALFDRTFAINVRGTFLALREATKRLRRGGRIINFSTSATMMRRLPRKKPRPDLTGTMSVATHRYEEYNRSAPAVVPEVWLRPAVSRLTIL